MVVHKECGSKGTQYLYKTISKNQKTFSLLYHLQLLWFHKQAILLLHIYLILNFLQDQNFQEETLNHDHHYIQKAASYLVQVCVLVLAS